jgi:hypothetical protein
MDFRFSRYIERIRTEEMPDSKVVEELKSRSIEIGERKGKTRTTGFELILVHSLSSMLKTRRLSTFRELLIEAVLNEAKPKLHGFDPDYCLALELVCDPGLI